MAASASRAFITGGNSGLGYETAKVLAGKGYLTYLGCRDIKKGEAAKHHILASVPDAKIEVVQIDLADLTSVRSLANQFVEDGSPLDVLINNAGVMACPKMKTVDGFEYQLGVNHLGHFVLTLMLLPVLKASDRPSRVINVASSAHLFGSIDFDDLMSDKKYNKWSAYGQSKLANILFTSELSKRLDPSWSITTNSLHPGVVATELFRHFTPEKIPWYATPITWLAGKLLLTPEQGAATSIYLATSPEVSSTTGEYFENCKQAIPGRKARNELVARKLWEKSLELTDMEDPLPTS